VSRRPTFAQTVDLVSLIEDYNTEDKCRAYLEALRWPEGIRCPRCNSDKCSRLRQRKGVIDCDSCNYQFSVTAGTILHDSHLPLWKWFLAVYVMGESKKGVSANQLKRMLRVSYKTAWYLSHRVRAAMRDEAPELLRGIVEADETYVGGHRRHLRGRSTKGKKVVIGAIERGGDVRLRMTKRVNKKALHGFLHEVVDPDAEAIITDAFAGYMGIADENTRHDVIDHGQAWVQADVHTNTMESVWSLFKRSIVGSYHHMSARHLPAYLDEVAFRFNNRENAYLFRDTLLRLLDAETMPYRELVSA
jgi:transposase-like protein